MWGFPGVSVCKKSAFNEGNLDSIPGSGRYPGGGHGNPLQCSCLENPLGQRSLAGLQPTGLQGVGHNSVTMRSTALLLSVLTTIK